MRQIFHKNNPLKTLLFKTGVLILKKQMFVFPQDTLSVEHKILKMFQSLFSKSIYENSKIQILNNFIYKETKV